MTPTANPEAVLESANQGLARLLNRTPLMLSGGGAHAMADPLWVWGVIGGKEVGKSTLINALAGDDVARPTERVGEGTFRPAAYCAPGDLPAVESRFAVLQDVTIDYRPSAPHDQRGLVLVDLPDFDSLYTRHIELVREVVRALDGIIWVTTPKKVGDLKAIREIRQVLKSRTNFVYVVNKMDWLLGQSNGAPDAALQRTRAALAAQVEACDGAEAGSHAFLISARHRSVADLLAVIAGSRDLGGVDELTRHAPQLEAVVGSVVEDFDRLRRRLTSAPSADEARIKKQANLAYQIDEQTRKLLDHFRPADVLGRLRHELSEEAIAEITRRAFPPEYCIQLSHRLQDPQRLSSEWTGRLFRMRISWWPLLGMIAWPLAALGALIEALRQLRPGLDGPAGEDLFRADGLQLEERTGHVLDAIRNRISASGADLAVRLPDSDGLARAFRAQAGGMVTASAEAAISPYHDRRPSWIGRLARWVIPLVVLAWFPLVQPVLDAALGLADGGLGLNLGSVHLLVSALSAENVLLGMLVAIVLLAGLTAAVYSGAVRDAGSARRALSEAGAEEIGRPLLGSIAAAMRGPVESAEHELDHIVTTLESLNHAGNAAADPADG